MRCLLVLLLLFPDLAYGATSNVFSSPRDSVALVSQTNTISDGTIQLALTFSLRPGWHIYWSNPGDAGLAPAITPAGPEIFGPLSYPPPDLLSQPPVTDYVLSGNISLPFTASHAASPVTATATWLVCADICVPEHASFTLPLPGGASAESGLFATPAIIPSPFPARIAPDGTLTVTGPTAAQVSSAHFFPFAPGLLVNGAPQTLRFTPTGLSLHLTLLNGAAAKQLEGLLELTDPTGITQTLSLTAPPGPAAAPPPYLALAGLAFLGGLILNLMPCVFPILAMKAVALTRLGQGARIRHEALGYTAGVLLSMAALAGLLLALRAAGVEAGWGFQFQSPAFVALIAWIFLAAAFNLAGLFAFSPPAALGRLPAQHSVLTGALAVAVATPCTAPFMGAAIAAALAAPALPALAIFLALGLGLATPFLLLAILPGLSQILPRPGAWMLILQRFLSLPMFASFIWLAWVLSRQAGAPGLVLMLLGAAFLTITLCVPRIRPAALAALLLLPLFHNTASATLTLPGAEPYTPARLAALRAAGQPVFIDLTAAWCVTCLVNEAATLKDPAVERKLSTHHVAVLVGDWTQKNAAISALLAANNRGGVPLYLYYPPGAATPLVLPQILTPGIIEAALAPKPAAPSPARGG
jgi:thiol:disulfide interchange protein DsbD